MGTDLRLSAALRSNTVARSISALYQTLTAAKAASQPKPVRVLSFSRTIRDFSPHHLYAAVAGVADLGRHLAFRRQLKHNSADKDAYVKLKMDLASHADAAEYLQAKTEFIPSLLSRMGA